MRALIDAKRADRHYYCQGTQEVPVDWITQIDGARILREIFAELSGSQVSFVEDETLCGNHRLEKVRIIGKSILEILRTGSVS